MEGERRRELAVQFVDEAALVDGFHETGVDKLRDVAILGAGKFSFETLPPPEPTLGFHGIAHQVRLINMTEAEIADYRPAPMVTY